MGAQFLERRIRGGVHERLKGLDPRGIELGGIAAPMRFGSNVASDTIARQQGADTTQTDTEPGSQLPHGALTVLVGLHNPAT